MASNKQQPRNRSASRVVHDPAAQEPRLDPRHCNFRLRLAPSAIHRWGVYAEERIPPNRKVIEYTGERVSRREAKRRSERQLHYLFTIDSYWSVDGAVGGSGAEYINHSCAPNVRSRIVRGHILYISTEWIEAGDELTVDYHFPKDVEIVPCACGAKSCRGTINLK